MWAVFKREDGILLWYRGVPGEWASDNICACRWVDKRDAQFVATYVRGTVSWVHDIKADQTQVA